MQEVSIRRADLADRDSIMVLWKRLMEFHAPLDPYFAMTEDAPEKFHSFLTDNLQQSDKIVMVAEINHKIIGYMMGMIMTSPPVFKMQKYGEITDAFVDDRLRKQGMGEKLFSKMKAWFAAQGLHRIDINAAAKNPISNKFWKKMGFAPYLNHMHFTI